MSNYRLRVTYTYSTNSSSLSAMTNINDVLANYPEITDTCTRSSNTLSLDTVISESLANNSTFRQQLTAAFAVGTRTAGKYSVARIGDT